MGIGIGTNIGVGIGLNGCLTQQEIINSYNGSIVENQDGTVSVFINNIPTPLTKTCCEYLKPSYVFDIATQKCRWSAAATCNIQDAFKLVLNPKGNDGTLFYIEDGENCVLTVDFDYLFKVKCETLAAIQELQPQILPGNNVNLPDSPEAVLLKSKASEQTTICEGIEYQLAQYIDIFANTSYSIVCNSIPVVTPVAPVLVKSVGRSAFGKTAPFGFGSTLVAGQIYCINEPDGLNYWRKLLGEVRYNAFINGDQTSYTCDDVLNIFNANDVIIQNNIITGSLTPTLLTECNTPVNTKSDLMKTINDLLNQQASCNEILNSVQSQISLTARGKNADGPTPLPIVGKCGTVIDFFESFDVSMSINVVTSANTLETVYTGSLLTPIGGGNLYTYLATHANSGFYVCGDPTGDEIQPNCTPLILDLTGGTTDNVFTCDNVVGNLVDGLYNEFTATTGTTLADFQNSLSPNAFASQWLHYHAVITDSNIITQIANKKIKLSININHTCGDFCVLIDEIVLDKVCTHVKENNIFLSQSPGFELDRIRDNKKSWIANTTPTNRPFVITNNKGGNSIRQTNYDVNDERLVINSKEIDLDINLAGAIETDVWCYISDNPCLLSGTCTPLSISCPSGYDLMPDDKTCQKIIVTATTSGSTGYTAIQGARRCDSTVTYGELGGVFYPNLSTLNLPLSVSGGSVHNQSVVIDSLNNIVPIQTTVLNSLWGNGSGNCIIPTCTSGCSGFYNHINQIGIWTSPSAPNNEWVGWSFCVNIPTTGIYTIGIAADDACRVKVNGDLTFSFDTAGWNFLAFRMFPITLNAGLNIIEMEVLNSSGSATLAAEIYSVDTSVISGITSEINLSKYIVFSTSNYIGQQWQTGEDSGFSCPSGYALDTCSFPYTCVKILKTDATIIGDCCDPCSTTVETCGNKNFQDNECYYFMDSEVYEFMDGNFLPSGTTSLNGSNCCGDEIDFNTLLTQPLSAITTIEDFEYFLTSELIDTKNRQTISGYPTLRALYDRYMNSGLYCGNNSSKFDYMTMDKFASLVGTYWVDIVEQVIPATTIWGSTKIFSNTIFDQQKFKYKGYSSLLCGNPYSGQTILSPINGTNGQCTGVSVSMTTLYVGSQPNARLARPKTTYCNSLCIAQMNSANEFIGKISITGPVSPNCDVNNSNSINESIIVEVIINNNHVSLNITNATAPIIYEWSNGETGPTAFMLAGTHSVTITDVNCNTVTTQFTVPSIEEIPL